MSDKQQPQDNNHDSNKDKKPTANQIMDAMAKTQQDAAQTANMCDRFLRPYTKYVGPVQNVQELKQVGQAPDLLSMRFAILKAVRDEESVKANVLASHIRSFHNNHPDGGLV